MKTGILPRLLGYNVRRAQMVLWRDFNRQLGRSAVRPGAFSLLVLIRENPGVAQVAVARQLGVDKATIIGLLDQLQHRQWVERRRSTHDRRRHGLFLTASGKRALARLRATMHRHEAPFLRLFTRKELAQLLDYLGRIQARSVTAGTATH